MLILAGICVVSIFLLTVGPLCAAELVTYAVPDGAPRNEDFAVKVNDKPCGVFANQQHAFAGFSFDEGPVKVEITCRFAVESVSIRPKAAGVEAQRDGQVINFTLTKPCKLSVEVNTNRFLFLFADGPERDLPDKTDPSVIWYAPGYHDLNGKGITLKSNQRLYISGGAYLDNVGTLLIENAHNVKVHGRGVLVGCTRILGCRRVEVEGIIINPNRRTWMNKIDVSQHVTFQNVKVMTGDDSVYNYDGFDVMSGCHHVLIDDVFVRATDDVLSIKHHVTSPGYWRSKAPISHVTLSNAVTWNLVGGAIIRIGPETIGPSIDRVTVRNMDVIHHESGSVFEILTVDGVQIRNVLFEGIRIEDASRPIIQFDMGDWYKVGSQHGHVSGVYFRDIDVQGSAAQGTIQGADAGHDFTNLYFDNVRWNGQAMQAGRRKIAGADVLVGADARPVKDDEPPVVMEAVALTTDAGRKTAQLYVTFSEPVEMDTAEKAANYVLSGGAHVLTARLDHRFRQVILSTSGMKEETAYTLTVSKVQDMAGQTVIPGIKQSVTLKSDWQATERESAFQGRLGWWYEQFNPAEELIFRNRPDRGTLTPGYLLMDHYATTGGGQWLGHDADVRIHQREMGAGQRFWAVRTWMAPTEGVVRVTGMVRRAKATTEEPRARIVKNLAGTRMPQDDEVLWDWHPVTDDGVAHMITTTVTMGSVIRFVVADTGAAEWDPLITYVPAK